MDQGHRHAPVLGAEEVTEINAIAVTLCDTYGEEYAKRYGTRRRKPRYSKDRFWRSTYWPVAIKCYIGKYDPVRYVQTAFSYARMQQSRVTPAILRMDWVVTKYKDAKDIGLHTDEQIVNEWYKLVDVVMDIALVESDVPKVLLNPMIPLPEWFRVLYSSRDKDVVDLYGDAAHEQLKGKVMYDFAVRVNPARVGELERVYGKLVP